MCSKSLQVITDGINIKSELKSCACTLPFLDLSKANTVTANEQFSGV